MIIIGYLIIDVIFILVIFFFSCDMDLVDIFFRYIYVFMLVIFCYLILSFFLIFLCFDVD